MKLVRYADREDLLAIRFELLAGATFPEYMHHNEPGGRYWGRLYSDHPGFQLALVDGDELVAELHSVPTPWDGTRDDLPTGWDDAFLRAFESGREPTVLCALAISVRPDQQGRQLSSAMLDAMREAAAAAGLRELIAPVRPTLKPSYPLIPIERYMTWRRDDGSHFDPWLRLHERIGGELYAPAPRSMVMEAPVADVQRRERAGEDVVAVRGKAHAGPPLPVRDGVGRHVEPNVWVQHALPR